MSKPRARCRIRLPKATSLLHGVRQQICLLLAGSGIVILVLVACALIYTKKFLTTFDAIQEAAQSYRLSLLEEVFEEVAATLVPIHRSVTRLAQRARKGSDEWLPPREGFIQPSRVHLDSFAAWLYAELAEESRIRAARSSNGRASPLPIIRMGAAVGLAADLETLAGLDGCEHAVHLQLEEGKGGYEVLAQHVEPAGVPGRGRMASTSYDYDPGSFSTGSPRPAKVARCQQALLGLAAASAGGAGNWSWTYEDLASGKDASPVLLHGTAPIYGGPDGRGAAVGRVHGTTRILAQTELESTPEAVSELPAGSFLLAAVEAVVAERGEVCPEAALSAEAEDRLVDAAAFRAEGYGLPPMGALRWCVIMTLPRESIYGTIDTAKQQVELSAIVISAVSLVSVTLLLLALACGNEERKRLELDKLRSDLRKVMESIEEVKELNCPMALIAAADFLALPRLEHHEALRDEGKLVVLDSLDGEKGILSFQERNSIIFISHQWLGFDFPDVEGAGQLRIMQGAISHCLRDPIGGGKSLYVWVDYISIAQCHSQLQRAAVSSLPVYASVADIFIIVAPTLEHADTHRECNLETYMRRGWCRAEMLSKACAGGLKDMYVATGAEGTGTLQPLRDLRKFSLNVFKGEFTREADQESLVKPVLGLYSLVLEDPSSEHMQQIHAHILQEKEAFFPRSYLNGQGVQVELFGPCVALLQDAVRGREKVRP